MKNRNSNFESDSRIFFQIRYKFTRLLKTKLLNKFLGLINK